MVITHLSLTNFRNYGRLELAIPAGTTLLHGDNAQGKTNLLEAIYYLATSRSPYSDHDSQLINWEAEQADEPVVVGRITAQLTSQTGSHQLEMRLIQERGRNGRNGQKSFRREALVNRQKVRLMDLLGNLRVVLFLPEDVQLITGPPSSRRRYMDITLCQIDPIYCRTLSHYNKTLEQRNALLRQLAEGSGSRDVLPIFTEKLVTQGSQIFARRAEFLTNLARQAQHIHYEALTDGQETIRLNYLPRLTERENGGQQDKSDLETTGEWLQKHQGDMKAIAAQFSQSLTDVQLTDIQRGTTSIGPHRDDWELTINGRKLSSYGSRGQQRSAVLALKLAEINWMEKRTGEKPILLLDEVVAEFDEKRRALLLAYVQQSTQALLTATDPGMFPPDFMQQVTSMTVTKGQIHPDRLVEL
ncbi:MAG: DNA replication/repair protein RecF [Ardenticatenaceae bacterium]|nr:DNA replication/repair protein RecF [Ardenticatenaceae bacterium]MCB9444920.1 DNA replication/repair protein RecF [Ardenticatenaceae bacterium]